MIMSVGNGRFKRVVYLLKNRLKMPLLIQWDQDIILGSFTLFLKPNYKINQSESMVGSWGGIMGCQHRPRSAPCTILATANQIRLNVLETLIDIDFFQ